MHNLVKLVQASGKALVIPADAVAIVRTLEAKEKDKTPEGKSGVWLMLGGMAQHAIVRESYGFILRKAGGSTADRVQLTGMAGTKISMPRSAFAHAIESERVEKDANGKETSREDATIVNTNLHSNAGPVAFFAQESAEDLHELLNAEASEDDGSLDEDDEVEEAHEPAKPVRKRAKPD